MDAATHLIWHAQVPLKVSIFVWRLLRDRLPTKANLISRGILSSETHHCMSWCREVKSAQQLFLSYDTFCSLWHMVHFGLAFLRWTLILLRITLFSLPIQQVVFERVGPFCSSSDLPAFGLYGVREIINCLEAQHLPYSNFWTTSRVSPLRGCSRQMLL
jgi:hypothetical protein